MHSVMVVLGGVVLLAICLLVSRRASGSVSFGSLCFIPLWFLVTAINMWVGVTQAGYTAAQEFPIFLGLFSVLTVPALVIWWRTAQR